MSFILGGTLTKVAVSNGEKVRKGQVLAEVDSTTVSSLHNRLWRRCGRRRMPTTAISDMLGFDEQASFSRYFHRETGLYPTEYRANI